jgi:diaminohydroxyphosphoribosylaminopyrimidine deaminase/5-amino-6-(5-phosphoribosylamino)uracil reductase
VRRQSEAATALLGMAEGGASFLARPASKAPSTLRSAGALQKERRRPRPRVWRRSNFAMTRTEKDLHYMRRALTLAKRGYGTTSPNPMVGAVLVKNGKIIGQGWHHQAGEPHAEIEALRNAEKRGETVRGSTLYVTLEPCCTHGRTPPCTDAIIRAGIKRVMVGAVDQNPRHHGKAFSILKRAGIVATHGPLERECEVLNEAFSHWIVHRTPLVTVKVAMTLDGKIATASGESKWITGERARTYAMKLRLRADAILVGINTVLADNPSLTFRKLASDSKIRTDKKLRRIILDSHARTPLNAKVATDKNSLLTTIVVSATAPKTRIKKLARHVQVIVAPLARPSSKGASAKIDLPWLLKRLGAENVTGLLVEGGGEINASFLMPGLVQRIAFFYAPKVLGGRDSLKAVAGDGASRLEETLNLENLEWRRLGPDWLLTARVVRSLMRSKNS